MQLPINQETTPPPDLKKSELLQEKTNQDIRYPSENVMIMDNGTKSEFSRSASPRMPRHIRDLLRSQ